MATTMSGLTRRRAAAHRAPSTLGVAILFLISVALTSGAVALLWTAAQ